MAGIDDNTLLLLHFEDIQDSSKYKVPITNVGAKITSNNEKFGGKSAYFEGTARVDLPSEFNFDFNSGNFTVEWWQYNQSITMGNCFWFAPKSLGYFGIQVKNDVFHLFYANDLYDVQIGNTIINSWHHCCLVKNGTNVLFFINGEKKYSANTNVSIPQENGYIKSIGGRSDTDQSFAGYIDEFRVSNVARWTENFTPPTEPYSTGSGIYIKINGEWKRI